MHISHSTLGACMGLIKRRFTLKKLVLAFLKLFLAFKIFPLQAINGSLKVSLYKQKSKAESSKCLIGVTNLLLFTRLRKGKRHHHKQKD